MSRIPQRHNDSQHHPPEKRSEACCTISLIEWISLGFGFRIKSSEQEKKTPGKGFASESTLDDDTVWETESIQKINAKDTGAGSQTNNSWNFIYGLNGWRAQESGHKKSVIGVNGGLRVTFLDHVGKKCTTLDYKTTTEKTTNGKTLTCKSSILSVIHEFCCMRK